VVITCNKVNNRITIELLNMKLINRFQLIAVFCFLAVNAFGQDSQKVISDSNKDWGFSITPYALLASQSTDVGGESIRQSFNDLASLTNSGFQFVGKVRYKRLSFLVDGTFANLGDDLTEGLLELKLKVNQNILDFKLGYIVYENFKFEEDDILKGWSLTLNAGTKYWKNKIGLDYTLTFNDNLIDSGSIEEVQDWWDLMLGFSTNFILSKKFALSVGANIGGFGIGDSSKSAFDFIYLNSFKVSNLIIINAGFRSFSYKRVDGIDDEELKTKVNVLGPVLGVSFVIL
jgi:hypothetical protein